MTTPRRVTMRDGMLLVDKVQVGEHNPTRWRCMVVGCKSFGHWFGDADPGRALSDHYLDHHWTGVQSWADRQIEPT